MSRPVTTWVDWPTTARQAGTEMDSIFMATWRNRDRYLSYREFPGHMLGGTHTPSGATWEEPYTRSKIWIPPWATHAQVRINAQLNLTTTDPNGTLGGHAEFRGIIDGTTYFEEDIYLACKKVFNPPYDPTCDGVAFYADETPLLGDGTWYEFEFDFEVPSSIRDATMEFYYEVKCSSNVSSFVIRNDPTNDDSTDYPYHRWAFWRADEETT